MKIVERSIGDLKPYPQNAKKHDQKQIDNVANSIRRFGWQQPIVIDRDDVVVIGHCRLLAAKKLGLETVPVTVADDLTSDEIKELRIADNKTNESPWDFGTLQLDVEGLEFEGFDFEGLTEFAEESGTGAAGGAEDDDYQEPESLPARAKLGDVYQLGDHRLMCGDSTNADDVTNLMNGSKADICFTSPPYNAMAGFHANKKISNPYMRDGGVYEDYGDNLSPEDYATFLTAALKNALNVCDDVLFNIGYTKGALCGTCIFLGNNAEYFAGAIHWEKTNAFTPVFDCQYGMTTNLGEPIYAFNKDRRKKFLHPTWSRQKQMPNIIKTSNAAQNEYANQHGATFPVAIAAHIIGNFSQSSVIDLFGGSGTTLIAAEQLGRRCYMMELDPHYVDVIVDRWEKLTGKKAVLLNDGE